MKVVDIAGLGKAHCWDLPVGPKGHELTLRLRRVEPPDGSARHGAVLLLHGGNSGSKTFVLPEGGLAKYLRDEGWDVWLLDWRGSPYVMNELMKRPLSDDQIAEERKYFTFDAVAETDFPAAIEFIRERIGPQPRLSVMAHCVSGGIASIAIAKKQLPTVTNVVLVALGLFYEVPWDGWIKVEDFILERLLGQKPMLRAISPLEPAAWPRDMAHAYAMWPKAWSRPDQSDMFRRLSFMFGQPWTPERLNPEIPTRELEAVFGPMHLGLFLHSGQMVRRGIAAAFDEVDIVDRARLASDDGKGRVPRSYQDPEPFRDKVITLITGSENRVWHRDSIDLMYDWLRSIDGAKREQYQKRVFPGLGLQDLFWSTDAPKVYEEIEIGLRRDV